MWCERCLSGFAASVVNFPLGSFASKHLSPLSNQGGHDPTNARRGVPTTALSRCAHFVVARGHAGARVAA